MAASEVSICNSALAKLGVDLISSLSDTSKAAILCNEQYDKKRQQLLRSHPWNFAIKRASLAKLVSVPSFEYSSEFQLPNDCLRVLRINDNNFGANYPRWVIEGNKLLANVDSVKIKYVCDLTDTGLFDENFSEALAFLIASDLSYALVQSASLSKAMLDMHTQILRDARSFDAQEGTPEDFGSDAWTNARQQF